MWQTTRFLRTFPAAALLALAAGAVLPVLPAAAQAETEGATATAAPPTDPDDPRPSDVRSEEEAILAPTLDDLFRDSLKRENAGEIPEFVLNKEGVRLLGPAPPPPPPPEGFEPPTVVYERAPPPPPPPWDEVVAAIARNDARPEHVAVVERMADEGRPEAVELLAWMRANGVAVAKDLPEAFRLYTRAHTLGVPNARENAVAVYRSMSEEQQQAARLPF